MEKQEYEETLQVRTFGEFSITYGDVTISGNSTQFICLMQLILHNRKRGIGRDELERDLFAGRDIADPHHMLCAIVYNAKKRLKKEGLPGNSYLINVRGRYYWTPDIPVVEDAEEFENRCMEAEAAEDPEEKLRLLLDACYLYKGEFLESYSGMPWAAAEARRYRELFSLCVERAAQLLRETRDYSRMKHLGIYASALMPFMEWEELTVEALIGMGRQKEAEQVYMDTVDKYFEQQQRPSEKFRSLLDGMGEQFVLPHERMDRIVEDLTAEMEKPGAYLCSYPVFKGIYRMTMREHMRSGRQSALLLCTIVDSKGNPMREGAQLDELSKRLRKAIFSSVRKSDVVNQYGKGQFLVLLMDTTLKNCDMIKKRINKSFLVGRQRTGIQYYVTSIIKNQKS